MNENRDLSPNAIVLFNMMYKESLLPELKSLVRICRGRPGMHRHELLESLLDAVSFVFEVHV